MWKGKDSLVAACCMLHKQSQKAVAVAVEGYWKPFPRVSWLLAREMLRTLPILNGISDIRRHCHATRYPQSSKAKRGKKKKRQHRCDNGGAVKESTSSRSLDRSRCSAAEMSDIPINRQVSINKASDDCLSIEYGAYETSGRAGAAPFTDQRDCSCHYCQWNRRVVWG